MLKCGFIVSQMYVTRHHTCIYSTCVQHTLAHVIRYVYIYSSFHSFHVSLAYSVISVNSSTIVLYVICCSDVK